MDVIHLSVFWWILLYTSCAVPANKQDITFHFSDIRGTHGVLQSSQMKYYTLH